MFDRTKSASPSVLEPSARLHSPSVPLFPTSSVWPRPAALTPLRIELGGELSSLFGEYDIYVGAGTGTTFTFILGDRRGVQNALFDSANSQHSVLDRVALHRQLLSNS